MNKFKVGDNVRKVRHAGRVLKNGYEGKVTDIDGNYLVVRVTKRGCVGVTGDMIYNVGEMGGDDYFCYELIEEKKSTKFKSGDKIRAIPGRERWTGANTRDKTLEVTRCDEDGFFLALIPGESEPYGGNCDNWELVDAEIGEKHGEEYFQKLVDKANEGLEALKSLTVIAYAGRLMRDGVTLNGIPPVYSQKFSLKPPKIELSTKILGYPVAIEEGHLRVGCTGFEFSAPAVFLEMLNNLAVGKESSWGTLTATRFGLKHSYTSEKYRVVPWGEVDELRDELLKLINSGVLK